MRIARAGHWQILTGCRKGAVTRAVVPHLARGDLEAAAHAAAEAIARLLDLFGHGNVAVELIAGGDRKSTRLNSSHVAISYAVFCLKKKIRLHIIFNADDLLV